MKLGPATAIGVPLLVMALVAGVVLTLFPPPDDAALWLRLVWNVATVFIAACFAYFLSLAAILWLGRRPSRRR